METTTYLDKDERPAVAPIWREARAGFDWLARRASPVFYRSGVPRSDGSLVIVVPGLLGSDVYAKTDDIVDWRGCVNEAPHADSEGTGTRVSPAFNPEVYGIIAARLADPGTREPVGVATG